MDERPVWLCDCPSDQLCVDCVDRALMWHRGVARARGIMWAESVARRRPDLIAQPWPRTSRCCQLARGKVAELCRDERVIGQLEDEIMGSAVKRWTHLQRDPAALDLVLRSRPTTWLGPRQR